MKAFEKLLSGDTAALTGYNIGRAITLRDKWINQAKVAEDRDVRQICVRAARENNREPRSGVKGPVDQLEGN